MLLYSIYFAPGDSFAGTTPS